MKTIEIMQSRTPGSDYPSLDTEILRARKINKSVSRDRLEKIPTKREASYNKENRNTAIAPHSTKSVQDSRFFENKSW